MKKMLLLVVVLATGCINNYNPKFMYHDEVVVARGFYKGCEGAVERVEYEARGSNHIYTVHMRNFGRCDTTMFVRVYESDLKRGLL